MTSAAGTGVLEQAGLAGRVESVRFDLIDSDGNVIGVLHPQTGVTIRNTTEGALKRSIDGFVIPPDEIDDVDIARDRVAPKWLIQGAPDEFPLGVFRWASASRQRWSYGSWMPSQLLDQGIVLGQGLQQTVSLAIGDSVQSAITSLCAAAGFPSISIDASSAVVASPVAFPIGASNTYASVLSSLAAAGGYFDWYFDNNGVLTFRTAVDPNTVTASFTFDYGGRIIDGTMTEENDALNAPNRYIVVDSAATGGAIVGSYDLPASDPNSAVNRGFVIPRFIDSPGIGSVANAQALAQAAAQQDIRAFETVTFQSIADPRHDTFDVVSFLGHNFIELGWQLGCAPGGPMEHTIKRVYQ